MQVAGAAANGSRRDGTDPISILRCAHGYWAIFRRYLHQVRCTAAFLGALMGTGYLSGWTTIVSLTPCMFFFLLRINSQKNVVDRYGNDPCGRTLS